MLSTSVDKHIRYQMNVHAAQSGLVRRCVRFQDDPDTLILTKESDKGSYDIRLTPYSFLNHLNYEGGRSCKLMKPFARMIWRKLCGAKAGSLKLPLPKARG